MKRLTLLFILLLCIFANALSQSHTITGTVLDETTGQPLQGATVAVSGTDIGTTTDGNGKFVLSVTQRGNNLMVSFIGYISRTIPIGEESTFKVILSPNSNQLNQVVVTALGIKRSDKSVGYSVSTLSGSQVDKVQTPNLVSALSGKVAGVDVSNIANGVAGTKSIEIRGGSSLTGSNQPLWIVDGVPINTSSVNQPNTSGVQGGIDYGDGLAGIDPDNIKSITVLKGNAAAALYGSRAANGVIIVTTKNGQNSDGKTHVDISSSVQFNRVIDLLDFQQQYGQTAQHAIGQLPTSATDAQGTGSWGPKLDGTPAIQFNGQKEPLLPHKNNYSNFFQTGSNVNNTVALSGGNANNNYRVAVNDLRHTDVIPHSTFSRTGINTVDHFTFDKLSVDLSLNYNYQKGVNRPFVGGENDNLFFSLINLPTNINIKSLAPGLDSSGKELLFMQGLNVSNPYFVSNYETENDERNTLIGGLTLKYDFTKWLYARGRILRNNYTLQTYYLIPENNMSDGVFPDGGLTQTMNQSTENNYEFFLGINQQNIGKLGVNGFIGGNIDWRSLSQSITSGGGFVVPGVHTFNNLSNKLAATNVTQQRTNSLFGSVEFSYNDYLYLNLTGRNDWFSTLPTKSNNLFYPAASLSFVFSDAFKLPEWISYGKFRASSAQVSGDPDPYQLQLSYTLDPLQYQGLPLQTIGSTNIPNSNLKPLLSTDYEVGLEMGFFEDRIDFNVDYYNKSIKNDIVTSAVSNTTGYQTAIFNVGELRNDGIEILLRATPLQFPHFSWNLTATFSTLNNRIISLGSGTNGTNIILANSQSGNASIQLQAGQKYGGIYGYSYKRDSTGKIMYNSQGLPDYNTSLKRLGNSQYNKVLGFSNTFNYKRFSLYVFLDGKFGADLYSETNADSYEYGLNKATLKSRENGFVPVGNGEDGKPNTVLVRGYNSPAGPGAFINTYYQTVEQVTEQFVYNASFVKLREVSLSYRFNLSFLHKIGFTNASVSLDARNLLTVYKDKNLKNIDPESSVSSANAQGIERMGYPLTRSYGFSIQFGL